MNNLFKNEVFFQNSNFGYCVISNEEIIIEANNTFLSWLAIDDINVLYTKKWFEFLCKNSVVILEEYYKRRILEDGFLKEVHLKFENKFGECTSVLADLHQVKSENNEITYTQLLAFNITKQEEYEAALLKEKLRVEEVNLKLSESVIELRKFARMISHDLKAPLNNIIALTQILKADHNQSFDDKAQYCIDYISQSSEQLRDLINDVLSNYKEDFNSNIDNQRFEFVAFLDKITKLLDYDNKVKFIYSREEFYVTGYKASLEQIFVNLISNAIKYNDKENIVIEINFEKLENKYFFNVNDNGKGISQDNIDRIFEPNFTLNEVDRFGEKGTGVGLSIVKNLIEKNEGKISISSKLGVGSEFKFHIKG